MRHPRCIAVRHYYHSNRNENSQNDRRATHNLLIVRQDDTNRHLLFYQERLIHAGNMSLKMKNRRLLLYWLYSKEEES